MLLAPISLNVTATLVTLLREAAESKRDTYLPDLALSVNNLAIRLGEVGWREQALALAREAAAHYHELARNARKPTSPTATKPGETSPTELVELFNVGHSTVHRALDHNRPLAHVCGRVSPRCVITPTEHRQSEDARTAIDQTSGDRVRRYFLLRSNCPRRELPRTRTLQSSTED